MIVLIFFGLFALTFGIVFLFFPNALVKMNEWGNKIVMADYQAIRSRKSIGIALIVISIVFFLVAYYIAKIK